MYMNVKGISVCHFCGKLVKNIQSHMRKHANEEYKTTLKNFENCGFVSYDHLAVTIMSRAKEFFKIKDLTTYIKSLDKISNDVHAISSVFNSIGVVHLKSDASSFKNIGKDGK